MNKQKRVATVEARMSSIRLPGKVMKEIIGKPMLELMVERLTRIKQIDDIIIATTTNEDDQVIVDLAQRLGVRWFRGSEEDVLDRVLKAAQNNNADVIVETTGDCPLIDPVEADKVISKFLAGKYDYVSNCYPHRSYPLGMETQVFPVKILEEASQITDHPADRENVSLYIYSHPEKYNCEVIRAPLEWTEPNLRLCVDTIEDFELVSLIFKEFYYRKRDFLLGDILQFLNKNPQYKAINAHVQQRVYKGK